MALAFQNSQFEVIINGDLIWTLLSLAFVYWCVHPLPSSPSSDSRPSPHLCSCHSLSPLASSYLWFHTGSYWLANIGMMQIMLSLPVAFFIYRLIFQLSFYTQLHVLVIFVVLGVGTSIYWLLLRAAALHPQSLRASLANTSGRVCL